MTYTAILALLFLLVPATGAVTVGRPETAAVADASQGRALSDSMMQDLRGKGSLSGFANGVSGKSIQVNQGSATQSSTIDGITLSGPGRQVQPLPSHITTTLQSLQRLLQSWRR